MSSSGDIPISIRITADTSGAVAGIKALNEELKKTKEMADYIVPSIKALGSSTSMVSNSAAKNFKALGESAMTLVPALGPLERFAALRNKLLENAPKSRKDELDKLLSGNTADVLGKNASAFDKWVIAVDKSDKTKGMGTAIKNSFIGLTPVFNNLRKAGFDTFDKLNKGALAFNITSDSFGGRDKFGKFLNQISGNFRGVNENIDWTSKGMQKAVGSFNALGDAANILGEPMSELLKNLPGIAQEIGRGIKPTQAFSVVANSMKNALVGTDQQMGYLETLARGAGTNTENLANTFGILGPKALDSGIRLKDLYFEIGAVSDYAQLAGVDMNKFYRGLDVSPKGLGDIEKSIGRIDIAASALGMNRDQFAKMFPSSVEDIGKNVDSKGILKKSMSELGSIASLSGEKLKIMTDVADNQGMSLSKLFTFYERNNGALLKNVASMEMSKNGMSQLEQFALDTGIGFDSLNRKTQRTTEEWERMGVGMNTFKQVASMSKMNVADLAEMYPNVAIKMANGMDVSTDAMRINQMGTRNLQFAYLALGKQMFWTSLGSMFMMMSWDRITRRQIQTQKEAMGVIRAEISLADAQEAVNDSIINYGINSEQAIKASRNFKLQQYELQLQNKIISEGFRETAMAQAMAISSSMGQIIGMGMQFLGIQQEMALGQRMLTIAKGLGIGVDVAATSIESKGLKETTMLTYLKKSAVDTESNAIKERIVLKELEAGVDSTAGVGTLAKVAPSLLGTLSGGAVLGIIATAVITVGSLVYAWWSAGEQQKEFNKEQAKMRKELGLTAVGINSTGNAFQNYSYMVSKSNKAIQDAITKAEKLNNVISSASPEPEFVLPASGIAGGGNMNRSFVAGGNTMGDIIINVNGNPSPDTVKTFENSLTRVLNNSNIRIAS
jgi:hypothetical protein